MKRLLAVASTIWLALAGSAFAQTTVNPTVPAANSALNSAPIRGNFAAAASDINGLLGMHAVTALGSCSTQTQTIGADCLVKLTTTDYQWYKYTGSNGYVKIGDINPSVSPPTVEMGLSPVPNAQLIANCSGSTAIPTGCTWSAFADQAISSSDENFPIRGVSGWTSGSTGTAGHVIPYLDGSGIQFSNPINSGIAGSVVGSYCLNNATSGNICLAPTTGALGTSIATFPANSGVVAELNLAQNWAAVQAFQSGASAQGFTVTGSFTATGLVTNADLANASITVNGTTCTLGGTCSPSATATSVTVGTTTVAGGPGFLYNTTSGGTLTATAIVSSAVLKTDGAGNPTFSTTLPSGLAATSMTLTTPTLAAALTFTGLSVGTCSQGLALDSSGTNVIETSCPGSASSVQVGTTTITSGTNGNCLYTNSGVLGNRPCLAAAQGRITLTANTPVMTVTASAQTTLRYDCYVGGQVPYYDGTQDQVDTISSCEVTDAMVSGASAGQVVSGNIYDVWWVHGGANRICLAMSNSTGGGGGWSADTGGSNTARGTGYTQLDRVTRPYTTNKNAIANCFNGATNYGSVSANQGTFLGTVYASANGQVSWTLGASASGGSAGLIGVWNMYNRRNLSTSVVDSGTPYNYGGSSVRQARVSTGNQIQFVSGLAEDSAQASYTVEGAYGAATGSSVTMGIGLDGTTGYTCQPGVGQAETAIGVALAMSSKCNFPPQIGFHTVSANEGSDGTHASTFDSDNFNNLSLTMEW